MTQEKLLGRLKAGFPTLKGEGPSLLGRNWLSAIKLDWQQIFKLEVNPALQGVLRCFSAVFKEELGTVQGVKARIHINLQGSPIFYKARTVPFALRDEVEADLDRLLKEDISESVNFSNWAAPIVPVPKGVNTIQISVNYKVMVNRVAKLDMYPLPCIGNLFTMLAVGKSFTKLDLSHAYQQVELEEESCEFVTINIHKGLFRYKRLAIGLASAPFFQRVMDTLSQGTPGVCSY